MYLRLRLTCVREEVYFHVNFQTLINTSAQPASMYEQPQWLPLYQKKYNKDKYNEPFIAPRKLI